MSKKGGGASESLRRMSHLLASARFVTSSLPTSHAPALAAHFSSQLLSVGRKSQVRAAPEVKRILCRACGVPFSATASISKVGFGKGRRLVRKCDRCHSKKALPLAEKKNKNKNKKKQRR